MSGAESVVVLLFQIFDRLCSGSYHGYVTRHRLLVLRIERVGHHSVHGHLHVWTILRLFPASFCLGDPIHILPSERAQW